MSCDPLQFKLNKILHKIINLLLSNYQMIDQLLRDFAEENFGKGYFPVCHGETEGIKMFGLMVKQKRSVLPRPFKKFNYVSLAGMEKFVQKGNEKEFTDATNSHITKEANLVLEADEEDGGGAAR